MKLWKKLLALVLALTLSSQLALPAMAAVVQNGDVIALTDKEGNVLKSGTQEDWEKEFPYGTFAFEKSEVACTEGEEGAQSIRILRLGGTAGKAEVTISVNPVISQLDDGRYSAAMAASFYDYILAVEDALPIAAYQPYGRDPQPLEPEEPVTVSRVESALLEDETDAAEEDGAANCALKLDAPADAWLWQGKNADGLWLGVADTETLELTEEALEESDFRCVFTVDGVTYCSESYHGEAYVCEEEVLPEVPADLPLNPEKSFHVLDPEASGIEALGSYEFTVVFAAGETEKEIRLTPVDDEDAENTELLALRISACKGGTLYDTANTLTVAINDNEPQQPSYFGFEVMDLTVDKAAGSAILTVRRSGALQYAASVDYCTLDGTAAAGKDYSETAGTLRFPPDMDALTVEVPLINDGELIAEEDSDLYFTVHLENPTGGGEDSAILPVQDVALVNLYNSGETDERNLATMLYTPEADDVSGSTAMSGGSIAGGAAGTVQAQAEERTYAPVDVVRSGVQGGIAVQTVDLTSWLKLDRSTLPAGRYWNDYADFGGMGGYANTNDAQGLAYQGWDNYDQVKRKSDGYMGRYAGEVGGENGEYLKWNTQTFDHFDQLFSTVYATYRGKTENNYLNQFHSTARGGLVKSRDGLDVSVGVTVKRGKPGTYSGVNETYGVKKGDTGLFLALGIEDVGGADTRHAGGSVYQIARGQRIYLAKSLSYKVHTVDDDLIRAQGLSDLYQYIAPSVSVERGKGGVKNGAGVYVGTELTFSTTEWGSVYQYAKLDNMSSSLFLSTTGDRVVNYGAIGKTGEPSTLAILGSGGYSFSASGGNLSTSDQYTVNVVLDRVQSISVNVGPSVDRKADDQTEAIAAATETFWKRANITVKYGEAGLSMGNEVSFAERRSNPKAGDFTAAGTVLTSSKPFKNIISISFGLPHADQILFNGVQYAGDDFIDIPASMLSMETLPFVYYASEYVSAESDMTLVITKVEHYIDSNGNGQLDGKLDNMNIFQLTDTDNGKDTLLRTVSAGDYSITDFTPVYGSDGKPVQQFLKFYYSMTPRCLSVPEGASADDPAQILPAFVTSVTDAGALSQLSREMQGYRFVDSGTYSDDFTISVGTTEIKKTAGSYSGDNKLMYGAAANVIETVDVPLGGDFAERQATYIYKTQEDEAVFDQKTQNYILPEYKSNLTPAEITEKQQKGTEEEQAQYKGWYLVDVTFEQKNWQVDYQGHMLYRFQSPDEIYISDPNFGQRLPIQGTRKDGDSVADINAYLGSLNERDTINLCIRPQGSQSTDAIHRFYGGTAAQSGIAAYDAIIDTSEHHVKVDSANPSGIRTVPDASALSNTSGADGSPEQSADSSESSNPMGEFNLDMGIELPSLSLAVTDYVTLITDGDQFGFSIGVPLFSAKKSKTSVGSDKERYVAPNQKPANSWSNWSVENPVKKNVGNAEQVKGVFTNFQETIKGDAWQSLKGAQERALKRNVWGDPLTDANGKTSYNDKLVKSANMEFSLSFNVTVMFKYSPVENAYRFSSAMILLQFGFQFRQEIRLSVCPILYAYLMVGVNLEAGGGLKSDREIVENTGKIIDINSESDAAGVTLKGSWSYVARDGAKGKYVMNGLPAKVADAETGADAREAASLEFTSPSNAFHAYFSGKLQVERKNGEDWESLGYISSDGSSPVLVMSGSKLNADSGDTTFRLTVLEENAFLDRVAPISAVRSDLYFSGITLSPSAFMEVGAGIGVELLKAEIYFKASIAISMSFATRADDSSSAEGHTAQFTTYQGAEARIVGDNGVASYGQKTTAFSFDSFNFRAGFGVRVVLLFFKFEMDLIQFGIDYDKGKAGTDGFHENGWKFAWYALNGQTIKSYSAENAGTDTIALDENFPGVKITIPANDFTAQRIFGPEEGRMVMDEIATYAYDPGNLDGREFQISGYASSGDAFRLATGLDSGSAYQLLTVGETNYLLYTVTREQVDAETGKTTPATGIHASQLVLSKVKNTGADVGLVNPADENDKTPYIPVDNDATGDLDFTAQVQGSTIRVTWVSYADTTADATVRPEKPTSLRPNYSVTSLGEDSKEVTTVIYMNTGNYTDDAFKPGEEPAKPEGEPTTAKPAAAPVRAEYWMESTEQIPAEGYVLDETSGNYYAEKYGSMEEAQQAYDTAKAAYDDLAAEWKEYEESDAYQAYLTAKAAYDVKKDAYDAWRAYFDELMTKSDGSAQALLANSAANTVVKTAEFTVGADKAFRAKEPIDDTTKAYKFLPAMSADGSFVFYARTATYTKDEKTAADKEAKEYYDATKGGATTDASGLSTGDGDPTAAFRYAYATSMNDVYGKTTQFVFQYNNQTYLFEPTGWATGNTRLSSVDLVMLDDSTFYLAYTATQTQTTVDEVTKKADETNVHKLYLQKGSLADGKVTLESAKLLRTLVDINEGGSAVTLGGGSKADKDGVYIGGTLAEAHEDPYFGKVRFLHGKLGTVQGEKDLKDEIFAVQADETAAEIQPETFLLFEMNGAAYVIREESLERITGDTGKGKIIPFFTVTDETRGRGSLDVGTDGDGSIAAVYTAAVPNTTNNAIYVAKYDEKTGSFGQGRMLAMNQMQVYEDSITNGWSSEDTEKAYLGQLAGYDKTYKQLGTEKNPLTSFTFSDLAVALGLKAGTTVTTVVKDENGNPVIGEDGTPETQPGELKQSTLVILARGTQTELKEQTFLGNKKGETTKVITPAYDDNGLMETNTGMYALSFGVGEKGVGEGRILFESDDFVPGAQLRPTVTFKNTGDVPIRGSEENPITVELWISGKTGDGEEDGAGAGKQLMTWTIQENVLVGQTVTTALGTEEFASPLPTDLGGRKFYFTVQEDGSYAEGATPLRDDTSDRTIELKPELAVEDLQFTTLGVEGDSVRIGVQMTVTNRGAADASAPYLLFEYQTGYESGSDNQRETYAPVDLTGSKFEVGRQTEIKAQIAALAGNDDLRNGILRLVGTDTAEKDRTNLKSGYQRTVTGEFLVSKDLYCAESATGSLNLKVSVRQDSATQGQAATGQRPVVVGDGDLVVTPGFGVGGGIVVDPGTGTAVTPAVTPADSGISVYSGEYVADNNQRFASLEQTTLFTAPKKLTLPLGSTMRLALPAVTTKGTIPQVTVEEINSQDNAAAETHMGVLYYNMGTSGTGADGFLVLSPSSEGSGIIRVTDTATSTFTDIAYTVTPAGSGINIYKNNDRFTWYAANGAKIENLDQTTKATSDWYFPEKVASWGQQQETVVPYLGDLSVGKYHASFTFETLAQEILLSFDGQVEVRCDAVEYQKILTAKGGKFDPDSQNDGYALIDLGANPGNAARRVTVKVLSGTASFDRMLERYAGNQPILPDTGSGEPQIYFGRTLPETASLKSGPIRIPVYVVDENGLPGKALCQNGAAIVEDSYQTYSGGQLHAFMVEVSRNGSFTISATNTQGKSSSRVITVDWFNDAVTTTDDPLTMTRDWVYRDKDGNPIPKGETDSLKAGEQALLQVGTNKENAEKALFFYSVTRSTATTVYDLTFVPASTEGETQVPAKWRLTKTVTWKDENGDLIQNMMDENGASIENPMITVTEYAEDQKPEVPDNGSVIQTRAQWTEITAEKDTGLFPVTSNGIYRLEANLEAKNAEGGFATEVFWVNRLNNDLPGLTARLIPAEDALTAPRISFTATKGAASSEGLARVELVGAEGSRVLAEGDGALRLSGSFEMAYNGGYTLTAVDKAGNRQTVTVPVTGLALAAPADAITTVAAKNNGKTDGSVIVHANRLLGGSLDGIGVYGPYNGYQAALIPAAEDFDQRKGEDFGTFAADGKLTWKSVVAFYGDTDDYKVEFNDSVLNPGVYVLYLRDTLDTNAKWTEKTLTQEDCLILRLTVNDGSVNFTTQHSGQDLTVNATGAKNCDYLLFPAKDGKLTDYDKLDDIIRESREAEEARAVQEKQEAIQQAQKDLQTAQDILTKAKADGNAEAIQKAEAAVEEAEAQLTQAESDSYVRQSRILAWQPDNIYIGLAYGTYQVAVRDSADHNRYLTRLVTLAPPSSPSQGELTEKQEKEIIDRNQTGDVAVKGKDTTVILPKGFLKEGDSVNALLLTAPKTGFTPGTVVTVTANGETHVIPWCVVTADGRLLYLATERGTYGLTENAKAFTDTVGYWAEDDIAFTSARELFRGTTDTTFSPDRTMTRAMFVTVLGRMAGVEETTDTASRFTDVPADFWCAAYVNWAAENGIIDGYADGSFRPNAPVQRQQMAKILCNFAKYLGENVDAKGSLARYTDRSSVSAWAVAPCIWATDCGLLQGRQDGRLDPHGQATRAQVSAVLHRYVEHILTQRLADAETLP